MELHPAFRWLLDSAINLNGNVWLIEQALPPAEVWPAEFPEGQPRFRPAGNGPCLAVYTESKDASLLRVFYPVAGGVLEDVPDEDMIFEVDGQPERLPIPAVTESIDFHADIPMGEALTHPMTPVSVTVEAGWARGPVATLRDLSKIVILNPYLNQMQIRQLVRGNAGAGEVDDVTLITMQAVIDTLKEIGEDSPPGSFQERSYEARLELHEAVMEDLLYQFVVGELSEETRAIRLKSASEITGLSIEEIEAMRHRSFDDQYGD